MREATIEISSLVRDERLRFREDWNLVGMAEHYADAMRDHEGWGDFPPLVCLELTAEYEWKQDKTSKYEQRFNNRPKVGKQSYPLGTLLLVGGFTRAEAADIACVSEAKAIIHHGTWEDALRLAWIENSRHGKSRSSNETGMVLESIHFDEELRKKSEREIARMCGCSRATVNRWRSEQRKAIDRIKAAEKASRDAQQSYQPTLIDEPKTVDETPEPRSSTSGGKSSIETPGPLIRKDAYGRPIPQHVSPLWDSAGPASKVTREIKAAILSLLTLKHGPDGEAECIAPGLARVDLKRAYALIDNGVEMINAGLPHIVCPECNGHGCKRCRKLGALTRAETDALPGDLDRKARAFQGVPS